MCNLDMAGHDPNGYIEDVMKRIAAPMVGGIFTSFLLELLVYPAVYQIWKWNFEVKRVPKMPRVP